MTRISFEIDCNKKHCADCDYCHEKRTPSKTFYLCEIYSTFLESVIIRKKLCIKRCVECIKREIT